jgi:predicted transporter
MNIFKIRKILTIAATLLILALLISQVFNHLSDHAPVTP